MQSRKRILLSTTMAPLVVFAGVAAGGAVLTDGFSVAPALAQCAPKKKCNPCAAAKCNPCAAACNPCNPCAAKQCGACNPCAAGACNPCNPCAGGGGGVSKACVVPRLQSAAKCNPCAVAKCNPCNPCAAAKCGACNPCAAAKCNPCAAAKCGACNPCAAAKCNPCAAAKCNPCAAAKCGACGACNPCAAGAGAELTDAEAVKVYDCLMKELKAAYAKSDDATAVSYQAWPRYSKHAYVSGTHGNRYVQNYANATARAYGAYEKAGRMPAGSVLAKDSFAVTPKGKVTVGPLFIMEKMNAGFNPDSDDWRYTMIMPNGAVFGVTKGAGSKKVAFCIGCHMSVSEVDSMLFLPDEYRVK